MSKKLTDKQMEQFENLLELLEKRDKQWAEQSEKVMPLLEQREALLKAGSSVEDLRKSLDPELAKLHQVCEDISVLRKAIQAMERGAQRPASGGSARVPTPGEQFTRSEHWKAVKEHGIKSVGRGSGWQKIQTGSRLEHVRANAYDSVFAGPLIQDHQIDRIVELAKSPVIHRRFLNNLTVPSGDTVKYSREKRELMLVTEVKATAVLGASTVQVNIATGLSSKTGWNTIIINGETHVISSVAINADGSGTVTLVGVLAAQADVGDEVSAPRLHFTGRGKIAPKSVDEWEPMTASVKKLMTHVAAEWEILEDDSRTSDLIDRRLMNRYARAEGRLIWYGNDATDGVVGFFNDADIPVVLLSAMAAGSTKLDALLAGIITVAANDFMPTSMVVNVQDVGDIWGSKDDAGQYILWQVMLSGQPTRLWSTQLEATTQVDVGESIVGAFAEGATLFVRSEEEIEVGQPGNYFLEDMSAIKIRGRFAFIVEIPTAFCIVRFS